MAPRAIALTDDEPSQKNSGKKAFVVAIGNCLEWYDFAMFGFFSYEISENFFVGNNGTSKLLQTFTLFAGAFLIRPLGALVIGAIGDVKGRKTALLFTLFLMGTATTAMGCLPTYRQIGVAAPILLSFVRLLQGFAVGGELVGVFVFMVESTPEGRRAFVAAVSNLSSVGGMMLASLTSGLLRISLTHDQLLRWGWRIPFLMGIGLTVVGFFMRRNLSETHEFSQMKISRHTHQNGCTADKSEPPLRIVLRHHKIRVLLLAGCVTFNAVAYYTAFIWIPSYVSRVGPHHVDYAYLVNGFTFIPFSITSLTCARIADRKGYHVVLFALCTLFIILAPLALLAVGSGSIFLFAIGQSIFAAFVGGYNGPLAARMVGFFPTDVRYTGSAMGYNIAQCSLGGTMPLLATLIVESPLKLNGVMIFLALIGLVAALSNYGMTFVEKPRTHVNTRTHEQLNEIVL